MSAETGLALGVLLLFSRALAAISVENCFGCEESVNACGCAWYENKSGREGTVVLFDSQGRMYLNGSDY